MSAVVSQPLPALRAMETADLKAVMAIERASYDSPWTEAIFRDCLRVGYHCCVYDSESGLLGYGIMSVTAGECHLLNICIHAQYRNYKLGTRLIEYLLALARRKNAGIALLEVRVSNDSAYRLYTRLGFNEIGLRKHYYPTQNGREDALILALDLSNTPDFELHQTRP